MFDEWYIVVANTVAAATTVVVVAAASPRGKEMPYREFNKTKPREFDAVRDPVVVMRWISDVEGSFYTCACPANLKFRYVYSLLCLGTKYWWNFITKSYSPTKKSMVTWELLIKKFKADYVPPIERERLAQ